MAVAYVWLRRSCTFITIDICVFDLADLMYGCGVCMAQTLMHIYSHGYSVFDLANLMYGCRICMAQTLMHIYYHRYMCV